MDCTTLLIISLIILLALLIIRDVKELKQCNQVISLEKQLNQNRKINKLKGNYENY